jgi:hypothetical protein
VTVDSREVVEDSEVGLYGSSSRSVDLYVVTLLLLVMSLMGC